MKMSKRFPISYIGVSVSTFLLHPIFNFSSCSAKADVCQLSTYRPLNVVRSSTLQALQGLGHSKKDAEIITDVLIFAELRGNNQGLIKLVSGGLNKNFESKEINNLLESPVSCKIDGGQRIGMVVVAHATSIAIDKAKKSGIAVVGCSNYASATGALGYWARKITDAGLIGIVMSQCNEMVAPHGSYEPIFGTNPIAIGIPTLPRPQILDMATSASAYYGIKMAESMGIPIASDIAYDCHGRETTDPSAALKGAIRVFDRSFKGSHLALMVELLAGALTGAAMEDKETNKNWGSLVIAIDPAAFGAKDDFLLRADAMCKRVKNAKLLDGQKEILLPGERGDHIEEATLKRGTLLISDSTFLALEELAKLKNGAS